MLLLLQGYGAAGAVVVFDFGLTTVEFPAQKSVSMPEAKQIEFPDRHTVEFDE